LVLKKIDFSNGELSANAVIATLTSSGLPAIEHKHDPLIGAQWTLAASAATVLIHLLMRASFSCRVLAECDLPSIDPTSGHSNSGLAGGASGIVAPCTSWDRQYWCHDHIGHGA